MANNRGTSSIEIPIRLRPYGFPCEWRIRTNSGKTVFVSQVVSRTGRKGQKLADAWELLREFLSISSDDETILAFLNRHGDFHSPIEGEGQDPVRDPEANKPRLLIVEQIAKESIAELQLYLRRMLLEGDPTLKPLWGAEHILQDYTLLFMRTKVGSQAEVHVGGVFPSILAAAQFKLLQGARFRTCARKDCALPFEVTSRHKRRFCSQYCAHITSLRNRRKKQKAVRQKEK